MGALRPAFSILLAIVPFLYLGQHFNRQHKKECVVRSPTTTSSDHSALAANLPWSIIDSWWVSNGIVSGRSS